MICSWVVGRECKFSDLVPKLRDAPWDLMVLTLTTRVKMTDQIRLDLENVASNTPTPSTVVTEILEEQKCTRRAMVSTL